LDKVIKYKKAVKYLTAFLYLVLARKRQLIIFMTIFIY